MGTTKYSFKKLNFYIQQNNIYFVVHEYSPLEQRFILQPKATGYLNRNIMLNRIENGIIQDMETLAYYSDRLGFAWVNKPSAIKVIG